MIKKRFIGLIVLLLILPIVSAENVLLTLRDINTNEEIEAVVIYIEENNQITTKYVGEEDILKLDLAPGTHKLTFKVDKVDTEGKDYFGISTLTVSNDSLITILFLYSASTLRGFVKDSLDNVVANAELKFECPFQEEFVFPAKTDKFGSFLVDYAPIGKCRVYANYKDAVGFSEISLEQGFVQDLEINLDRTLAKYPLKLDYKPLVGLVLLILVIAIIILATRRKKKPRKHVVVVRPKKVEVKEESTTKRSEDILKTLNAKERKVVEFIMEQPKKETYQANIRHSTGIPRTSLSRILDSLEQKKVAQIEKHGKAVRVKLTDWFLGKE